MKQGRKKGFTLIEAVIVLAIFGILVSIIMPTWSYYLQRSKYKAQNAKAKAIFNAAQTVVTDLNFAERKYRVLYGLQAVDKYIYTPIGSDEGAADNEWYYYWDGSKGYRCDVNRNEVTSGSVDRQAFFDEWNKKISDSISRIVSDEMCYVFWVKDYKVQAVVSSNSTSDEYIGAHPTNIFDLKANNDPDLKDLKKDTVLTAPLNKFDLDLTN